MIGIAKPSELAGSPDVDDLTLQRHIGRRIGLARKQAGFSRSDLASRLGISPARIARYEQGTERISVDCIFDLAETLAVSAAFFFRDNAPTDPAQGFLAKNSDTVMGRAWEVKNLIAAFEGIANPTDRADLIRLLRYIAVDFHLH